MSIDKEFQKLVEKRMMITGDIDYDNEPVIKDMIQLMTADITAAIDEYYINMMIAWYFATALAKQYGAALPYIEQKKLETWTHNKTIQKAVESYRITKEQKEYLRSIIAPERYLYNLIRDLFSNIRI